MDSFSLYCLATECDPSRMLQVLGLIEARLARNPDRADDRLYKGALLARMGADLDNRARGRRFIETGLALMRGVRPAPSQGGLIALKMLYARGLTTAILPHPPVTATETREAMESLLQHPGFHRLHPRRRAYAAAAMDRVPGVLSGR